MSPLRTIPRRRLTAAHTPGIRREGEGGDERRLGVVVLERVARPGREPRAGVAQVAPRGVAPHPPREREELGLVPGVTRRGGGVAVGGIEPLISHLVAPPPPGP